MDDQPNAFEQMAAALNGHDITDDEGMITDGEDPSEANTAALEQETSVEEPATVEKPAELDQKPTQEAETGTEPELAEDETGKRYVPEKRFKDVYGRLKAKERELDMLRGAAALTQMPETTRTAKPSKIDKAEMLEVEMLRERFPQFNPDSENYSRTLDEMGAEILTANPGITRIEAARRALARAASLSEATDAIRSEARTVKAIQSDRGITNRSAGRMESTTDVDSMSDQEMEAYLKRSGQW